MKLDGLNTPLADGTHAVLRTEVAGHPRGTAVVVTATVLRKVRVRTPAGEAFEVARDQLSASADERRELDERALDEARDHVILEVTVGSRAWGLDDADSDEDIRGTYVASFEESASLFRAPSERRGQGPDDAGYWEIEKTLQQALRADPNTLEMLWSPLVRRTTPLGDALLQMRDAFISRAVIGSFGRYAIGQLRRVERALDRRETLLALIEGVQAGRVHDHDSALTCVDREALERVSRSLRDRGLVTSTAVADLVKAIEVDEAAALLAACGEHRPKNAYNLVRLLHSCQSWVTTGQPLIRVEGEVRRELLSIKRRERPIEETLARARELWCEIEASAHATKLPDAADAQAADRFLLRCRRAVFVAPERAPPPALAGRGVAAPVASLTAEAVERYLEHAAPDKAILLVALTGAHAYGFPSPDSDLDLKGIHLAPGEAVLAREPDLGPLEIIEDWEGREHDLSTHELAQAVTLLLRGNGNMLERLLGPYPVYTSPAGEALSALAAGAISARVYHHYRGFFRGMRRELRSSNYTKVKRALYAYRVALTGTHLLQSGELIMDVNVLAADRGLSLVAELVAHKATAEKIEIDLDQRAIDRDLDALSRELHEAFENTKLPAEAANQPALERFVVDQRLATLRGTSR